MELSRAFCWCGVLSYQLPLCMTFLSLPSLPFCLLSRRQSMEHIRHPMRDDNKCPFSENLLSIVEVKICYMLTLQSCLHRCAYLWQAVNVSSQIKNHKECCECQTNDGQPIFFSHSSSSRMTFSFSFLAQYGFHFEKKFYRYYYYFMKHPPSLGLRSSLLLYLQYLVACFLLLDFGVGNVIIWGTCGRKRSTTR
jgi:hypothetical protein